MSATDTREPVAAADEPGRAETSRGAGAGAARPARRRWGRWTALGVAVVLTLAVAMFAIVTGFQRETGALTAVATTDRTDDLELVVTMLNVDPTKNEITVRLDYTQFGRYESKFEPGPGVDLEILNTSLNKPQVLVKKDTAPPTSDLVFGLTDDNLRNYPFDHGSVAMGFVARTADHHEVVPLAVAFMGDLPGYSLRASGDTSEGWAYLDVGVSRSDSTIAWAMFVVLVFWLISGAVITVWVLFLRGRHGFEFGIFIWCAGMLFAFAAIRNSLPNAPPIGALVDFVSFFWAEALVCLTLVAAVLVYAFRRRPPPDSPP